MVSCLLLRRGGGAGELESYFVNVPRAERVRVCNGGAGGREDGGEFKKERVNMGSRNYSTQMKTRPNQSEPPPPPSETRCWCCCSVGRSKLFVITCPPRHIILHRADPPQPPSLLIHHCMNEPGVTGEGGFLWNLISSQA